MLAYSSVSQIGYIVLGVGLANATGLVGSLLHILNHGFMKACLFTVAAALMLKTGGRNIYRMHGIHRRMPFTMAALAIAALSMVGVPPTCGFFSKWYLILGAIEAGQWVFAGVILLSSLLTAVYFMRVVEIIFFRPAHSGGQATDEGVRDEIPMSMSVPLWILAAGILLLGLFNEKIVTGILRLALPAGY
jgi:multicomponent Na+:H+ antiporter subunit D